MMKNIILDRDGVINYDSDDYIKSPEEWTPIPGSLEAIARLHQADYRVFVVSNQSGIARGLFDLTALDAIHRKMHDQLALLGGRISGVFFCPHRPRDHCECRKPKPGLLHELGQRMRLSISNVPMIGDSVRDMQAAAAAGARPLLVRTGNGAAALSSPELPDDTVVYNDLAAAVDDILG